jgi:hypothetical protein
MVKLKKHKTNKSLFWIGKTLISKASALQLAKSMPKRYTVRAVAR